MTVDEIKQLLQLEPLRMEGGFFRETYRSRWMVSPDYLPEGMQGMHSIGTAIYFMITPESYSRLHRVPGSEIFHFYLGDPVTMLQAEARRQPRDDHARQRSRWRRAAAGGGSRPCVDGLPSRPGRQVCPYGYHDVAWLRPIGLRGRSAREAHRAISRGGGVDPRVHARVAKKSRHLGSVRHNSTLRWTFAPASRSRSIAQRRPNPVTAGDLLARIRALHAIAGPFATQTKAGPSLRSG